MESKFGKDAITFIVSLFHLTVKIIVDAYVPIKVLLIPANWNGTVGLYKIKRYMLILNVTYKYTMCTSYYITNI